MAEKIEEKSPEIEETFIPKDLIPFAEIQRIITDIKPETFVESVEKITNFQDLKNKEYVPFVIKEILIVVPLRHKRWEIYIELVKTLSKIAIPPFKDFKKRFLDAVFRTEDEWEMHNKATIFHFARICFKAGIFSANEIMNRITAMRIQFPLQYFLAVCYFAPEMSVASPGVYSNFVTILKKFQVREDATDTMTQTMIPPGVQANVRRIKDPVFQEYVNSFDELCENNFEKLIPLIETGCHLHSVEYDIYMDDVESLQTKVGKTYNTNRKVDPNPFHPAMFVQWRPTLLEMAAFYGSLNCFNYLLKRRAKTSFVSIMATAGGFPAIMERVKELDVPFQNCLRIAAAFRNFEAIDWILANCESECRFKKEINYIWARAAYTNYLPMLDYCIKNGCDINYCDENDQTALHLAAEQEHKEAVLFILSRPKLRFRKKNVYGWNAHSMTKNTAISKLIDDAEAKHKEEKAKIKAKKKRF